MAAEDDRLELQRAAEQGNANAQYELGRLYYEGQGVPQDDAKAAEWYGKAAEQGYAEAQLNLGILYAVGWGVPRDDAKAAEWYGKAAEQGYAEAQLNLGDLYFHGQGVPQDYAKAVEWFNKAAEQRYAEAQNKLGSLYEYGRGVPQDYAKAAEWYAKAAEQGYAWAQNNLGDLYSNGQGVPQDYAKAAEWYGKAAAQGHAKAKDSLAKLEWPGKAAEQGHEEAKDAFKKMSGTVCDNMKLKNKDDRPSLLEAAEQGDVNAQFRLGNLFFFGAGVPQNYAKAAEWYGKAAEQGDEGAKYCLAKAAAAAGIADAPQMRRSTRLKNRKMRLNGQQYGILTGIPTAIPQKSIYLLCTMGEMADHSLWNVEDNGDSFNIWPYEGSEELMVHLMDDYQEHLFDVEPDNLV